MKHREKAINLLHRPGSKQRIAKKIISYFPPHNVYIELFSGTLSVLFNKPIVKYEFCNDNDKELSNLWQVLMFHKEELRKCLEATPISQEIYKILRKQKKLPKVWKAIRYLYKSNFTYMALGSTVDISNSNGKEQLLQKIDLAWEMLNKRPIKLLCVDFAKVMDNIHIKNPELFKFFIYSDPPYYDTGNKNLYGEHFLRTEELIQYLISTGHPFAISESDHPEVIKLADKYNLNKIEIEERVNLKGRMKEMLYTNYTLNNTLF